jgi:teichuronic acid biosynthesis glycosyltransferase TuaG
MDFGKVSIITPMYNDASFISDSIKSVLSQTYTNWEMIIVDDCSTDEGVDVVQSFHDPRILLIRLSKNNGAAGARNVALQHATGKWVAFLDADDEWGETKLEKQISFMKSNKYLFTYSAYQEKRDGIAIFIDRGPKVISRKTMLLCDYIGCLTVIYDRVNIGLVQVDTRIKKRNDYAMWLQISKKCDCYFLNDVLAVYRIRHNSVSHVSKRLLLSAHFQLFRIQENFGYIKSWVYALRNAFVNVFYKKLRYRENVKARNYLKNKTK